MSYKKNLYLVGLFFVIVLFSKVFLSLLLEKHVKKNFINEYILSKYSKDIRYDQFYLLNKNKYSFKTYLFCTSACLVMNPDNLIQNGRGFNVSIGAGQMSDFIKYFRWIIKNRSNPKKIFIGIEFYSLSDFPFIKSNPYEIEDNVLSKIKNLYLDLSFEKFIFDKYLLKRNAIFNEIEKQEEIDFANNGRRLYKQYSERKNSKKKLDEHKKKLINQKIKLFDGKISSKEIENLNKLIKIASQNNVKISLFFVPVHSSYLKWENGRQFFNELKLIKEILSQTDISEIIYFNNFNIINKDITYFEHDVSHMNYDAGVLIEEDLKNNKPELGIKINKHNLITQLSKLKIIYEEN